MNGWVKFILIYTYGFFGSLVGLLIFRAFDGIPDVPLTTLDLLRSFFISMVATMFVELGSFLVKTDKSFN